MRWDVKKLIVFQSKKFNQLILFLTHPIALLFLVNVFVYGVFVPLLGFYWDDIDFIWFFNLFGVEGIQKFFSTGRPILGLIYQFNMWALGDVPWRWQVFSLLWRWICASGLYFLIRQLWKERTEPAFIGAAVFLLYPGFSQQFIAICYGHFFIIMSALFYSLGLGIYALDARRNRMATTTLSILLAILNVFSMEYFFMLELLRPFLYWVKIPKNDLSLPQRFWQVVKKCAPYFLVFLAAGIWRIFIFKSQTRDYRYETLNAIVAQPFLGILQFIRSILSDLWLTVFGNWGKVFSFPAASEFGKQATYLYIVVVVVLGILLGFSMWQKKAGAPNTENREIGKAFLFLKLGLLALLLGGIPFWVTGLKVSGSFPNDRFSLPYILGSSFFMIGILFLLPKKPVYRRVIFVTLIALAGGLQVKNGISYQRDWKVFQRFLWQMTWRIPAIEPGTTLYSQELPLKYFSDMSLTAPINMIYDQKKTLDQIPYVYYYPTIRMKKDGGLTITPNQPIVHDLLIGDFIGNTSQSLVLYYEPPACLRILDPEIESNNWMVPLYLRETSQLSNLNLIQMEPGLLRNYSLFGEEEKGSWCYYFEKADLARQKGNWSEIVDIAKIAFALDDSPNDPAERLPFIEGFAHTGNWPQALELSETTFGITPAMKPLLCKLWQRIGIETQDSVQKEDTLLLINNQLNCIL
ncbi:MAG: hypothetical protein NTZ74_13345 [Chloroflexi bacterium]|nr:hypothetical protein [Chloroflexota bacterium]